MFLLALLFSHILVGSQDFFKLVQDGDLEKVRVLINKHGDWINKRNQSGKIPAHFAAEKGHADILALLLQKGSPVDAGNVNGTTPLHYACFNNHLACVKLLLKKGADVNKANKQSMTPLSYAVLKNNDKVAAFLLQQGAAADCPDQRGVTPLHTAARNGNLPLCRKLIEHGAHPTKKDTLSREPLFYAAEGGKLDIIKMLAARGADIHKPDQLGKTPLYNALAGGHVAASRWLLDHKIDLKSLKTRDGSTYLHAAAAGGSLSLTRFILARGEKKNIRNLYGETPMSLARANKHDDIVSILKAHGLHETEKQNVSRGPYLGQPLPGATAEIFAPGVVTSRTTTDRDICFTRDLKTLYFTQNWKIKQVELRKNGWTTPVNVFSGKYLEAEGFLSPDEKMLYFLSRRPINQAGAPATWEVWTSLKSDQGWSTPQPLGDPFKGCFYTTFTRDYVMYYTGRGNDIYYSPFQNGRFAKPKKLGAAVNTKEAEYNSFIAPDESYLIFTSIGMKDHYGGGDLYIAFKQKDGTWTPAANLGPTVNTPAHEYCPSVSPDGKYFFFSSTRLGNKDDVYWMKIPWKRAK